MRHAKHRRPSFVERHEADMIVLIAALIGVLIGTAAWIQF